MSQKAKVLFDYVAEQEDELTLAVGDVITQIVQEEGGWWRGEVNGKTGVFPENFVALIKDGGPVNQPPAAAVSNGGGAFKALVKFEYEPEQPDELYLNEGDIIEDIEIVDEGWWRGTRVGGDGKSGMFPSNFVEKIEGEMNNGKPCPTPEPEVAQPPGDAPSSVMASLFSGMKPSDARNRLKKVAKPDEPPTPPSHDLKPTQLVPPMVPRGNDDQRKKVPLMPPADLLSTPPPPASTSSTATTTKPIQQAKALFDYEPEQPDELKLEVGMIITVIESELTFDGWMKGEVNGKVGVFPDNFVEVLPPAVASPPAPMAALQPAAMLPPAPAVEQVAVEPPAPVKPHGLPPAMLPTGGIGNAFENELAKKLSKRSQAISNPSPPQPPPPTTTTSHPSPPLPHSKLSSKAPPPPLPGSKPSLPGSKPKPGLGKPLKPPLMKPQEPAAPPQPLKPQQQQQQQQQPLKPEVPKANDKPKSQLQTLESTPSPAAMSKTPERVGSIGATAGPTIPAVPMTSTPVSNPPLLNGEVKAEVNEEDGFPVLSGELFPYGHKPPLTATPSLSESIKPTEALKHFDRVKPPGKSPPSKFKDKTPPSSPPTASSAAPPFDRTEVNELKEQMSQLQSKMVEMEGKFNRLLTQVTDDLAEERKLRLSQQVEIDSLKKKLHVLTG